MYEDTQCIQLFKSFIKKRVLIFWADIEEKILSALMGVTCILKMSTVELFTCGFKQCGFYLVSR